MDQFYIKQIIPNLYIGSNIDISDDNFVKYNIKNIINVNNNKDNDDISDEYNIFQISIKDNDLLIKSNNIISINFNSTNNFIQNSYIDKQNILINSNNIVLSAIIAIGFIIKKLDITLIDAIYYVFKFININLKYIPSHYIHTLFTYHNTPDT